MYSRRKVIIDEIRRRHATNCHKARLQRWNQQLNDCIDAVARETLKLERKQSIYRKLGFIYTKKVL